MADHYYSEKPQSESAPITRSYQLRGRDYTFVSDVGVFSKRDIDFGTRLLIEAFEEPDIPGDLLDLGCGYGPIGISLAGSYLERHVFMVDINERAVMLAEQNAKRNHVHNIEVHRSDGLSKVENHSFSAIVTNPPIRAGKKVIHQMYEDSYHALLKNGELWVVIQKKQGAPSTKEKLMSLFGNVDIVAKSKGYFIFKAKKV